MDRRRFVKYAGAGIVTGAAAIGGAVYHLGRETKPSEAVTAASTLTQTTTMSGTLTQIPSTTRATTEIPTTSGTLSLVREKYSGRNLEGWEVVLGDALYAAPGEKPVDIGDIETLHFRDYSEVRANVRRRRIMAHNITFLKRIRDDAFKFIHRSEYRFRLPYMPSRSQSQTNPQTIEGHIALWDGSGTVGKRRTRYTVGWQWLLNPWDTSYRDLRIWRDEKWSKVSTIRPDTSWHALKMELDFRGNVGHVMFDSGKYAVPSVSKALIPAWGSETAAWIAAEAISVYPGETGDGAMHRAQFRDWIWVWEPY
jgi:hypothetical protein